LEPTPEPGNPFENGFQSLATRFQRVFRSSKIGHLANDNIVQVADAFWLQAW